MLSRWNLLACPIFSASFGLPGLEDLRRTFAELEGGLIYVRDRFVRADTNRAQCIYALFRIPVSCWCERGDLNPHGFLRQILSLVRLPISPLSLKTAYTSTLSGWRGTVKAARVLLILLLNLGEVDSEVGAREQRGEFEDAISVAGDVGAAVYAGLGLGHFAVTV